MFISKISGALLAAALLCLLATGCRYTAAPADLLEKPTIASDKQALVQAVQKALPPHAQLALPMRDDNLGAVRLLDVDGDGIDEVLVSFNNEYSSPELMLLRYRGNTWKPYYTIQQPLSMRMDWMKVSDYDKDGKLDLAVGWIGSYDGSNMVELYSLSQTPVRNEEGKLVLEPEDSLPYLYAEAGDLNGDGKLELAVVTGDWANQEVQLPNYKLTVYEWTKGKLHALQQLDLSNDVINYDRLLIGKISERHTGIVLEAAVGAHSMYTFMYVWEKGKLRPVALSGQGEYGNALVSGTPTQNEDINGDGIIELSRPKEPAGYPDLPYAGMLWVNEWLQWDGDKGFKSIKEEFTSNSYQISFTIPNQWKGRYTLRSPEVHREYGLVTFEYWNEKTGYKSELGTLYAVPLTKWGSVQEEWKETDRSYHVVFNYAGLVYIFAQQLAPPGTMDISDRQLFYAMQLNKDQLPELLVPRPD
ncbi:FG-GAP repeat domain-containing protein [Paenibacillus sp. Leaf72]|uniref:FG-GAP repeat domain-containing protein n=1 Tax=Paenibacillus sp. Leaf72 TaxID=1736234 RepID=UPI0006FDABEE|nr:VCBS repeat-containing protein [Paenibacillus sp. Leaf72]KQO18090.1 hypothetical protein ASF12_05470 [Paenibacillus sp. Leaf72]